MFLGHQNSVRNSLKHVFGHVPGHVLRLMPTRLVPEHVFDPVPQNRQPDPPSGKSLDIKTQENNVAYLLICLLYGLFVFTLKLVTTLVAKLL